MKKVWAVVTACFALGGMLHAATVTVSGTNIFQTIDGFGVNANPRSWTNNELQPVLDALIDRAGMTIFRLVHDNINWESVNDNSDPNVMNWSYYNAVYSTLEFQKIWNTAAYFNEKGITNLMFNFQGSGPSWLVYPNNTLPAGNEDEWSEMIASLLYYARYTRHLNFNMVAPDNEPDISSEGIAPANSAQYVTMLHKLAQKLDTNGLSDIQIIGPELSYGGDSGTNWIPEMLNDPIVMSHITRLAQHSYHSGGYGSIGISALLKNSAYPSDGFWLTEFNVPCSTCERSPTHSNFNTNGWTYCRGTAEYLVSHLANGASAGLVWEGYDGFYPHSGGWIFWGLFAVDDTNAIPKTYTPRKNFYTVAQISRFVRPGAQRLGITGSPGTLELLAFYHPVTGQFVLTGVNPDTNSATLSCTLNDLPPLANLELYYTTSSTNLYDSGTFPLTNNVLTATIPADCVFTFATSDPLYTPVSVQVTNPPPGTSYSNPSGILIAATASSSAGQITNVEFFADTVDIGGATESPYEITWSDAPAGVHYVSARAFDSAGNAATSQLVPITVVGALSQIILSPSNTTAIPWTTQQFTALGMDVLGSVLSPQPTYTWTVNGGGFIDSTGLFSAGDVAGPISIQASNSGVLGFAAISVVPDTNRAPGGSGLVWYSLASPTDGSPQAPAPGLNDGNLSVDVHLFPGGGTDVANAYEAAGIVWPSPQTLRRVLYKNGSYDVAQDGVFSSEFALQFSEDGFTWYNAGPEWTVTPAYIYNASNSAGVTFTFTGGSATVLGVRCCGQVHTAASSSWVAFATELQAFTGVPTSPPPALIGFYHEPDGVTISWPGVLTNYFPESTTNLDPQVWSPVTNTPWQSGLQQCITVSPTQAQQFFRLHSQ